MGNGVSLSSPVANGVERGGTGSSLAMAVVHMHHTRKRALSDYMWCHRWSCEPAPTSIWGPYGLLGTQWTTGASALCPAATLSLFVMADDHICRRGSGVFPVQAVTVTLAGCNRNTLGLKRARERRVGKGRSEIDFHNPYGNQSPKDYWDAKISIVQGQEGCWESGGRLTKL